MPGIVVGVDGSGHSRKALERAAAEAAAHGAPLIVLTIHQPQFMAEVKVAPVEPTPGGGIRVHTRFPLAALDQHCCIRDHRIAADMIEMKMRVDDEVDLAGISVNRFEPRTDFFARLKADTEKPDEPRAESSSRVVLAIGVQPGVEQRSSLRVLDQKDRDRDGDVAFSALH